MKKFIFLVLAMVMMAGAAFTQVGHVAVKKHLTTVIPTRATPFGDFVKAGDLIWILADSTLYYSHVDQGPGATGTTFLATRTNYTIVNSKMSNPYTNTFSDDVVMDSTLIVKGLSQSGYAGADGQFKLYSEQGTTDYSATINPNSAMTSAANFYLPADEPSATYPVTMTTGGVMGFNDQAVTTATAVTFATVNTGQGANELYDMDQNVMISSDVTFNNINTTGYITIADSEYMGISGKVLIDSSRYYYDDNSPTWAVWHRVIETTPSNYVNFENIGDIKILNKTGDGLVTVVQRDTTGSTAKVNLAAVKNITAGEITSSATDTASVVDGVAVPLGTLMYRTADSTMWIKIKLTGTKAERWNKITTSK